MTGQSKLPSVYHTDHALHWAAQQITQLMEAIENDENYDNETLEILRSWGADLTANTTNAICLFNAIDENIASLEAKKDFWKRKVSEADKRLKSVEKTRQRFESSMVDLIKASDRVAFESSVGKMKVQKNSSAKLEVAIKTDEKTFRNIISEDDVKWNDINQGFLTLCQFYTLNLEAIKKHLANGGDLKWATLSQGFHLRIHP